MCWPKVTTDQSDLTVSKIFEIILLKRLQDTRITIPNQFGFKHGHSTGLCIFLLNQILKLYA